jgi:hypothetical protein
MRNLVVLFIHFSASLARLLGPAARSLVAKSLVLKHQRVIVNLKPSTHWATSAKLCGKQLFGSKKNGELLTLAEGRWYVLHASDRNIKHQQNTTGRSVSILIPCAKSNRMKDLLPLMPACAQALLSIRSGRVVIFDCLAETERCEYPLAGRSHCD